MVVAVFQSVFLVVIVIVVVVTNKTIPIIVVVVVGREGTVIEYIDGTTTGYRAAPELATVMQINELMRAFSDDEIPAGSIDELELRPHDLSELIGLVTEGRMGKSAAKQVLRHMLKEGGGAQDTMEKLGLEAVRDDGQIEAWCKEALANAPSIADDVRAGKDKAVGALIGPVMQASRGSADPQLVRETLLRLIREGG